MSALHARTRAALARSPFAARAEAVRALLLTAPDAERALQRVSDESFRGLARAAAANPEQTRYPLRRPSFLLRLAEEDARWPLWRATALDAEEAQADPDLERFLDAIRLQRCEETLLGACLDFAGRCDFEDVSRLLSALAEAIVRRALVAAERSARGATRDLGVVAMGKLGGREFTYHSDLDLIFLARGDVEAVHNASRVAQRLISYVQTRTAAGACFAVDSRLRPSGNQGMLVTSFEGFESYQGREAATWEYLALVRARAIAGARADAAALLARVQARVFGQGGGLWSEVADMRRRIEAERARNEARAVELKTGAGGLMDVEFLAEGAVLELGRHAEAAPLPSIPDLLRACAGAAAEPVLRHYAFLRRVESRMRWCVGRAVESLSRSDPRLADVAELVEPGLGEAGLLERLSAARADVRRAFDAVVKAGTIRALG